jgi:hypothetical protein
MPSLGILVSNKNAFVGGGSVSSPTNLVVTPSGSANNWTLTAEWTAPTEDTPSSYEISYSEDGGAFTGTQTVNHPTTTYAFTGLTDGIYMVRVRAVYADGTSPYLTSDFIYDTFITVDFRFDELTHSMQFARGGF